MLKLGRRDNPEILGKWLTIRTVLTERKFSTKISGIFLMNGKKPKSKVAQTDFVLTVKAGQVYPPRFC